MSIGWKTRASMIGLGAAALIAAGSASPAAAATRTMNATFQNDTGCALTLLSANAGTYATWVQAPPSTVPAGVRTAWSLTANLGLFSTSNGYAEYTTSNCDLPLLNGTDLRVTWMQAPVNVTYYGGTSKHPALTVGVDPTEYWGPNPKFYAAPTLT